MRKILFAVIFLVTIMSCLNERDCTERPDTSSIDQEQLEKDINIIEAFLEQNDITFQTYPSGVRIATLNEGTGDQPDNCGVASIDFERRLLGSSQTNATGINASVTLSNANERKGLRFGLYNMKSGGEYRLYVPSSLAFGADTVKNSADSVVIPPNSNLEYRIRLNGVSISR